MSLNQKTPLTLRGLCLDKTSRQISRGVFHLSGGDAIYHSSQQPDDIAEAIRNIFQEGFRGRFPSQLALRFMPVRIWFFLFQKDRDPPIDCLTPSSAWWSRHGSPSCLADYLLRLVSKPSRQPATEPSGSYSDRSSTGW